VETKKKQKTGRYVLPNPAMTRLLLSNILDFFIQLVKNDKDVVTTVLLLSNMLLEELSLFQMNGQNGPHFVFKIIIVNASLHGLFTKENGNDVWNNGHTLHWLKTYPPEFYLEGAHWDVFPWKSY
jgi:hypothetical protein